MSNGSGSIIIHNLVETPGVTDAERLELKLIQAAYENTHKCTWWEATYICRVIWRLLR